MSIEKEGMVNGSSSTSRVSSNFALARTAPLVHSAPCRRFYFLQMETGVSTVIAVEWRRSNPLPRACPAARPSSAS